ncbi:DUF7287 family protein [Halostagnicola bangensis]
MIKTRSHWVSSGDVDRGQTAQDFAIGIGIFLLAVAFAFATVPSLVGPDAVESDSAAYAQADRVATAIVDDLETGENPNELDGDRLENEYDTEGFPERFGLRTVDGASLESVTISLETLDRETSLLTWGDADVDDHSAVTVERLVSVDGINECQSACRLTVGVGNR